MYLATCPAQEGFSSTGGCCCSASASPCSLAPELTAAPVGRTWVFGDLGPTKRATCKHDSTMPTHASTAYSRPTWKGCIHHSPEEASMMLGKASVKEDPCDGLPVWLVGVSRASPYPARPLSTSSSGLNLNAITFQLPICHLPPSPFSPPPPLGRSLLPRRQSHGCLEAHYIAPTVRFDTLRNFLCPTIRHGSSHR